MTDHTGNGNLQRAADLADAIALYVESRIAFPLDERQKQSAYNSLVREIKAALTKRERRAGSQTKEDEMPVKYSAATDAFEEAMAKREQKEMRRALEADGKKLRQLTGQDHGPYFPEFLRQRSPDDEPFECPEPITCQLPTCDCGRR